MIIHMYNHCSLSSLYFFTIFYTVGFDYWNAEYFVFDKVKYRHSRINMSNIEQNLRNFLKHEDNKKCFICRQNVEFEFVMFTV